MDEVKDFADVYALSADDAERARRLVGQPRALVARALVASRPIRERWADTLLAETERNSSPDYIRGWAERQIADDDEFVAVLMRANLTAHMAGQLFIRDVEAPELTRPVELRDEGLPFVALPFDEAIAHFRARRILTPEAFAELEDLERMRAFAVSRAVSQSVAQRAHDAVSRSISDPDGPSMRQFIRDFVGDVDAGDLPGGARGYLANVFRTSSATSYNAGRYVQQTHPDIIEAGGIWRYVTALDERVRAEHASLHGAEFAIGSPEGSAVYPPNGFNCRCVMVVVDPEDARGTTVDVADVEGAIQPGFRGAPGATIEDDATRPASVQVPGAGAALAPRRSRSRVDDAMRSGEVDFVRDGMRDLTGARSALAGKSPAEATRIVTQMRGPAPFDMPIRVEQFEDGTIRLEDGRHRLQAAREAGATRIQAVVTTYDAERGVVRSETTTIPTGGDQYRLESDGQGGFKLVPR